MNMSRSTNLPHIPDEYNRHQTSTVDLTTGKGMIDDNRPNFPQNTVDLTTHKGLLDVRVDRHSPREYKNGNNNAHPHPPHSAIGYGNHNQNGMDHSKKHSKKKTKKKKKENRSNKNKKRIDKRPPVPMTTPTTAYSLQYTPEFVADNGRGQQSNIEVLS